MKYFRSLFIYLFLLTSSCTEFDVETPYQLINFKPTQCANSWDNTEMDPNKTAEDRFRAYLLANRISEIKDFSFTIDENIYCQACTCPSNKTYIFKIKTDELPMLKSLNEFKELDF